MKVTINEQIIEVKEKKSILVAARDAEIYIPSLCDHPRLRSFGACRLCIVQIEGVKGFPTACTTMVEDGLKIITDSEEINRLRRNILGLILSEHPSACLLCESKEKCKDYQECIEKVTVTTGCKFCPKNQDCELQKVVDYIGLNEMPLPLHYRNMAIERTDPFFDRDYNLCILCGRCVRVCQELRGAGTLAFINRGSQTIIGTAFNRTHLAADCQFCGACVDVCPTGALNERFNKWSEKPERSASSFCPLCSIGCKIKLNVKRELLINSTPDRGPLCARGRFGIAPLINHRQRVTVPLLCKDDRLIEITWDEAFEFVATKLNENRARTGIIFSPSLSLEALGAVKKLQTSSEKYSAGGHSEGSTNFEFDNIRENSVLIVLNTDFIEDFSVLLLKMKEKKKPNIIVIDCIRSKIAERAEIWLRPGVYKETVLLRLLFDRRGKKNTTGVKHKDIEKARSLIANRKVYLLYNPFNVKKLTIPDEVELISLIPTINSTQVAWLDGLTNEEIISDPTVDCLYLIGEQPKLTRSYKTVIVQDNFLPNFKFDIFLPTATFVETEGGFINIEGKEIRWTKVIEPKGRSMPDDWIIKEIIKRIGGMTDSFAARPRSKAKAVKAAVKSTRAYPLILIVRENCYRYRGHSLSSLMKGFKRFRNDHRLWLNPADAKKLKLHDGQEVRVVSQDWQNSMPVYITDRVPTGMAFTYHDPNVGLLGDKYVRLEVG